MWLKCGQVVYIFDILNPKPMKPTFKPMTKKPKRLHIYKPEDVLGNMTGPYIRMSIGYKNYCIGFHVNDEFVTISLIFRHIGFSFKPTSA